MTKKLYLLAAVVVISVITVFNVASCKKDDNNDNPPDPQPPVYTDGQGEVGEIGGTVKIENSGSPINGASIEIPEDALSENVNISIVQPDSNYYINGSNDHIVIDIHPSGIQFAKPVKIGIPYTSYSDEAYFGAFYYNPEEGILEELDPVSIDKTNKIFYCETDHTSFYTCQEVRMDIELVKVNDEGNTRIGVFANIWTLFENIPTGLGFALNGYPNAYSILYSDYLPGVGSDYVVSLYEKGDNSAVGTINLEVLIHEAGSGDDEGTVRVGEWAEDGSYVSIIEKENLLKEYIADTWMSGFPLLFTFKNYSPDDSKEYYAKVTWVEEKRNSSGQKVMTFTDFYRLGKKSDAQKISDLSWEDGDANLNYILDDYEGVSGQAPVAPGNVYAGDCYDSPGVYWDDNSSDENGFKVYRAVNQINTGYSLLGEVNIDETHIIDNDISGNNFYCYMVQAFNEYGQSESSEYAVVPKTPISIQGEAHENDILIYWTDPNNSQANRFIIERKAGASAEWETLTYFSASETSYQDNYVQSGTQYYYRVLSAWTENNSDFASISFPSEEIGPYEISGTGGTGEPCPGLETITYGGQVYNTVLIGNQCWLKENLNIGEMISGVHSEDNGTIEKYCYDNDPANCDIYGGLYQWNEMMDYTITAGAQGICPDGWHIPTDDEWKILEGTVDSQYPVGDPEWDGPSWRGFDVGKNLKSTSGWNNNGNGTDLYGFSALPNDSQGEWGGWWSSDDIFPPSYAWARWLSYDDDESYYIYNWVTSHLSVRCLRD